MRRFILISVLVALLRASSCFAQKTLPADPCGTMPKEKLAERKNFLSFDQFNRELRSALTSQDAFAMAFLVKFPLRVNDAGGTITVDDAGSLNANFQRIFTPAVRKEILSSLDDKETFECNIEGVGYGTGVIWVGGSERGYAIWSVNVTSRPSRNKSTIPHTDYVCQTQSHRIAIDSVGNGPPRYRSWNKPRPVTDRPDLEIAKGEQTFEGTDLCAVPVWTFKEGTTVYSVAGGLGCYDTAEPPPDGARGSLNVTIAGKQISTSWCF